MPMIIGSISFMIYSYLPPSMKEDVTFYLGMTDMDQLSTTFAANYLAGTRMEVLHLDTLFFRIPPGSGSRSPWTRPLNTPLSTTSSSRHSAPAMGSPAMSSTGIQGHREASARTA